MGKREKIKKYSRKSGLVFVEIIFVIALLCFIGVCAFAWRLLSGPLEVAFAKPYILEALRDEESGVYADMQSVVLFWPDVREPILLGLQGAAIYERDGSVLASIDEAALGINKMQLVLGRVRPEALILRKPSLGIVRTADNSIEIGVADLETFGPEQPKIEDDVPILEQILSALNAPEGVGSSPLAYLKSIEVVDASLLIDDKALDLSWVSPNTDILIERAGNGFQGRLYVGEDAQADLIDAGTELAANFHFDPDADRIAGDVALSRFDVKVLGEKIPELALLKDQDVRGDAKLEIVSDTKFNVQSAVLSATSEEGSIFDEALSAEAVPYEDFVLQARYDGAQSELSVESAQLQLRNVLVVANAALTHDEKYNADGRFRLAIEDVQHASLVPLWPTFLEDDNAKDWIIDKLSDGRFMNNYAEGTFTAQKNENEWVVDTPTLKAGFSFEGMSVDYRAPLKAVKNAKGSGVFDIEEDTIRIDIEEAKLLNLNIPEAAVLLTDVVADGKGDAEIDINLNGPAADILRYIKDEPLGVDTGMPIDQVKGKADAKVKVKLPTRDNILMQDVEVSVDGTITDAVMPKILRGMTLTGGPFDLQIADNLLSVKGKGRLKDEPAEIEYQEYLVSQGAPFSSKAKAVLMVSESIRDSFGMDLSEFLSGPAFADVNYTKYTDGRAEAVVKADLTPSRLYINPFDYVKTPGEKGELSLKAVLKNDSLQRIENLKGTAPNFTLETSVLNFMPVNGEDYLSGGNVSRFVLGDTVANLEFERLASGLTKLVLNGPILDARPFLNDDEDDGQPYDAPPLQISVAADKMRTENEEMVTGAKLYMDIDGAGKFNQFEMDARAGQGDIYLRFKPDGSGKRVFRLEADDAGATLKAFGMYEDIRGGKLKIYAEPKGGLFDRNLFGKAEMTGFRVVKAPALARLVSAMSLGGVTQALNNEGLVFTKMESDFEWKHKPEGSLLVLKNGRTSGNTLGLSFDGTFDNAANTLDVKGTIIPLSGVNKMIGDIPLVGDILTGGTGALIAATYTLTGNSDDPKVSVNPLSVLTPGFLRRILFEQN